MMKKNADANDALPQTYEVEDEFITLNEIYCFISKWKFVFILPMLICSVLGLYFNFSGRSLTLEHHADPDSFGIQTLEDPLKINSALLSTLTKEKYTAIFAEEFFRSFDSLPQDSDGLEIRTKAFFENEFAKKADYFLEKNTEGARKAAIHGMAQYLVDTSTALIKNGMKYPSWEDFSYSFGLSELNTWRFRLKASEQVSDYLFIKTSISAFNKMILTYNRDKEDENQFELNTLLEKSKLLYKVAQNDFVKVKISYEEARNNWILEFNKLVADVQIVSGKAPDGGSIVTYLSQLKNDSTYNHFEDVMDRVETNDLIKSLATSYKLKKLTSDQLENYLSRLQEITKNRVLLKADMSSAEAALGTAQISLSKVLSKTIAPHETGGYALAGAQQIPKDLVFKRTAESKTGSLIKTLLLCLFVGFAMGLFYIICVKTIFRKKQPVLNRALNLE